MFMLVAERFQRLQDRRKFEPGAFGGGRPFVHHGAMRHVDESQTRRRIRRRLAQRGLRRKHGIQQRQGKRHPNAAQKRAAREMLLRDEHQFSNPPQRGDGKLRIHVTTRCLRVTISGVVFEKRVREPEFQQPCNSRWLESSSLIAFHSIWTERISRFSDAASSNSESVRCPFFRIKTPKRPDIPADRLAHRWRSRTRSCFRSQISFNYKSPNV